jgi:hypothetical protein
MPARTTEKSYRPRVSDRTMVGTRASVWLAPRFRIARNLSLCSPERYSFPPAVNRPLTAIPDEGE